MMVVAICETSIAINQRDMEICIGAECIKYKTEEQFKTAYELVMAIAKFCNMKVMNERMIEALRSKVYKEGV
jgi:hypothetical protein